MSDSAVPAKENSNKLSAWVSRQLQKAQAQTHRKWYPFFLLSMAALDLFLVIIPTDGLVVASVYSRPKRWFLYALAVTVGSTLGAIILGAFIYWDAAWLAQQFPAFFQSDAWVRVQSMVDSYGEAAVFFGAVGPFPLQPFVIVPSLANLNPIPLIACYFAGRFIKFFVVAWLASHSPKLLSKIPGVGREWKEYEKRTGSQS